MKLCLFVFLIPRPIWLLAPTLLNRRHISLISVKQQLFEYIIFVLLLFVVFYAVIFLTLLHWKKTQKRGYYFFLYFLYCSLRTWVTYEPIWKVFFLFDKLWFPFRSVKVLFWLRFQKRYRLAFCSFATFKLFVYCN